MNKCIFHDVAPERHDRLIFEIVEQAYNRHERVLIFVQNMERAAAIDRTIWTIKQEAFIPHKIFSRTESDSTVPIGIVTEGFNPNEARTLIVDGHCSLDFACGFDQVHEFVNRVSAQMQEACRDRFRAYRDRQINVEHLKE
jgi:DNA polymerase IIIc chi subunit